MAGDRRWIPHHAVAISVNGDTAVTASPIVPDGDGGRYLVQVDDPAGGRRFDLRRVDGHPGAHALDVRELLPIVSEPAFDGTTATWTLGDGAPAGALLAELSYRWMHWYVLMPGDSTHVDLPTLPADIFPWDPSADETFRRDVTLVASDQLDGYDAARASGYQLAAVFLNLEDPPAFKDVTVPTHVLTSQSPAFVPPGP
jgi:hypothetical protein